jgi:uncharacterized protein (TIGR02145 family)
LRYFGYIKYFSYLCAKKLNIEHRINKFGLTCTVGDRQFVRGHECVDLGLPSGTLWAKCNLGAEKETDFGNYYQFGQFEPYDKTVKNYTPRELDTVGCVWRNGWKTPTQEQFRELIEKTNNYYTEIDGVKGYIFINKNNKAKYVFFPAAGYCSNGSVYDGGSSGYYWSSSLDSSDVQLAYYLYFLNGYVNWQSYYNRCYGFSVRGVVGEN